MDWVNGASSGLWFGLGFVVGFCVALLASRSAMRRVLSNAAVKVLTTEQIAEKRVEDAKARKKVVARRLRKPQGARE